MKLYNCCKRIFDIIAVITAIIVLSPILLISAVIIKFGGKGPVIFKQERAGKNGKPFMLYKFRTMKLDVDPFGPSPKSGKDPRLTKTGLLLREYSLDELPQLFNVLKNNMSVVGPRPLYVTQIAEWNDRQKRRLDVQPGLTGLAQISGRGALTREEKLELDAQYVDRAGFWFDIKIIFATITTVLGRKSIYEKKYSESEYTRNEGQEQ